MAKITAQYVVSLDHFELETMHNALIAYRDSRTDADNTGHSVSADAQDLLDVINTFAE